jgi:predicted Zn-ribbon and HTH transcriptional regulator
MNLQEKVARALCESRNDNKLFEYQYEAGAQAAIDVVYEHLIEEAESEKREGSERIANKKIEWLKQQRANSTQSDECSSDNTRPDSTSE